MSCQSHNCLMSKEKIKTVQSCDQLVCRASKMGPANPGPLNVPCSTRLSASGSLRKGLGGGAGITCPRPHSFPSPLPATGHRWGHRGLQKEANWARR